MVKKYFTWVEMVSTNGYKAHIKPTIDNNWHPSLVIAEETGYGFTDTDRRRLGIVTLDYAKMTVVTSDGDTLLDRLKTETAHFGVRVITNARALALCNEWYPPADGDDDYFSLDGNNNLVDGRPEEDLI